MWVKYIIKAEGKPIGLKMHIPGGEVRIGGSILYDKIIQEILRCYFDFKIMPFRKVLSPKYPNKVKYKFIRDNSYVYKVLDIIAKELELTEVNNLEGIFR